MPVLTALQMRAWDQYTIAIEPISSLDLMERAADALYHKLLQLYPDHLPVYVFCGPGNNGGDGLALARMLLHTSYSVTALLIGEPSSDDARANLTRLREMENHRILQIKGVGELPDVPEDALIIDALFGTGLSRPAEGLFADVIRHINALPNEVISIDMPSGLFSDAPNAERDAVIEADHTLTFGAGKLSQYLCQDQPFVGELRVLDIGLMPDFPGLKETAYELLELSALKKLLRRRAKCDHKGTFGHALVWAGSYGKIGAALICAEAVLRAGAGLCTAYIPGCGYGIFQTALPECMALVDPNQKRLSQTPDTFSFETLAVGPGIGTAQETKEALRRLLKHFKKPLVLDADALNILSQEKDALELIAPQSVLTPHPKEFERLAGHCRDDWERLEKASAFAEENNVILVLKSGITSIHAPDGRVWFSPFGTPALAKGGSGDALTGILAGLLSQGYKPLEAAQLGVALHGLAGQAAEEKYGVWSPLAREVVRELPAAYRAIKEYRAVEFV